MSAEEQNKGTWWYHVIAILVIVAWGASFPCTRLLLDAGITPTEIFVYRSAIAYLGLLVFSRFNVSFWGWKDETLAILCGLTGGAMYFVLQNIALKLTLLSDVVIVIAVNPLLTTILAAIFLKEEHFSWKILLSSMVAFAGVAVVTFRDGFVWGDGLLGNVLAFLAALSWAVYCIILKRVQGRHSTLSITRKVMIYGTLCALPVMLLEPTTPMSTLLRTDVLFNMLFLALVCSMAAFFIWNLVIKKIGAIRSSNYLYLDPIVSIIIGVIVLNERVGVVAVVGCALVLLGVILVEKTSTKNSQTKNIKQ
ncbi:MAG: DMT family transporter [Muribaculaceae bacterium]|nr:DMT family transporter [Muribaculaceae bacterium]